MLPLTAGIAALIQRAATPRPRRVVVVGAGVLGLCAGWALARRGHDVTVLEAGDLPDARASSADEGRIIRHAYGTMEGYAAMMPAGFRAWRALFAETGADRLVPCRAVYALRGEGPWEAAVARSQEAAGLGFRRLDEAALAALPMLNREGLLRAMDVAGSGMLLARPILDDLVALLPRLGVTLRGGAEVAAIERDGVRLATGERVAAEQTVIAAGAWAPRILPELAATHGLRVSLQTVAYLEPPADLAAAWAEAPLLLCRLPDHPTGGVYVLPPRQGTRLKLGDYATDTPGAPFAIASASARRTTPSPPDGGRGWGEGGARSAGRDSAAVPGHDVQRCAPHPHPDPPPPRREREKTSPSASTSDTPGAPPDEARRAALLDAGSRAIAGFARHRVTEIRHCLYTMAPEDRFVLRPAGPGAWLASACSGHGFKLAPLIALGLAAALEQRIAPADLAFWAAGREGEASLPGAKAGS